MRLAALLAVLIAIAIPAEAKPVIRVTSPALHNVGIDRQLEAALALIPGSESLDWTIVVEPHAEFQKTWLAKADNRKKDFPGRCFTYADRRETHCDASWVLEFSAMAKAGTLAHEYGHILCGSDEDAADACGAQLMHGVPAAQIRRLPAPGL